jgi:hypothetical protein
LNQKADVSVHEPNSHSDSTSIRHDCVEVSSAFLDETENIIPAAIGEKKLVFIIVNCAHDCSPSTVQTGRMIPELEQDLLHMKSSRKGLDQNRRTDGSNRHADVRLREAENIIPKACFEIMFHFGEIKVGSETTLDELFGVVIKIESKIEDGAGDRGIVDGDTRFVEMPSSRTEKGSTLWIRMGKAMNVPNYQNGRIWRESV